VLFALIALLGAMAYLLSNTARINPYNHFVWQAEAFLDGRAAIRWPVSGANGNSVLHDVMPILDRPGFGLVPFPPLPAVLLMPFVAIFGVAAEQDVIASILGGINVGLAWLMVSRLTPRRAAQILATLFFAFGTVHWYAAMLGSTWFFAHVVASTFLLLAITLALDADRAQRVRRRLDRLRSEAVGWRGFIDPLQFAAGVVFGLAALARLPVIFGAPFFLFVGGGGSYRRRAVSAGIGASIPVLLLLAYNIASTGQFLHPAYDYLYEREFTPRPELVHRDWMIEDPRYIPQNSLIMLGMPPDTPLLSDGRCTDPGDPDYRPPPAGLGILFDRDCPLLKPNPLGMSLLLTSPAYLLALPLLAVNWRRRLVLGAALAVGAIALFNLMHFSQGWVQFGYRFSNDFAPFALVLVARAIAWLGVRPLTVGLVGASILINAWGVYWGLVLGW
jgi:hypothetical protein